MLKKKICFIAQFPPPMHGLSKAVETLYNSDISNEFELEKVDITNNKKFLINLIKICKSKADLFYFTISQTKGGNLRDLVILKLLEFQHKKCLIHLHGGYYRQLIDNDLSSWQRKANYKTVGKLDGAIVLGPSLKYLFQGMLSDEKIFTVANCVDDEYLMPDEDFDVKMNSLPNRKIKHILYLSNFIKSKGYPEVLEMAKLEKERVEQGGERHFHFDFAGKFFEKSEEEFFWNYLNNNKITDYVTFHGVVGGEKKRELLKKCDVFALLTTYPKEGQPISILEAMGNGLLVVTIDHAGIGDIVSNNTGIIFPKENVDIANKTIDMLYEGIPVDKLIESRNAIINDYNEKKYVSRMDNIFRHLLIS